MWSGVSGEALAGLTHYQTWHTALYSLLFWLLFCLRVVGSPLKPHSVPSIVSRGKNTCGHLLSYCWLQFRFIFSHCVQGLHSWCHACLKQKHGLPVASKMSFCCLRTNIYMNRFWSAVTMIKVWLVSVNVSFKHVILRLLWPQMMSSGLPWLGLSWRRSMLLRGTTPIGKSLCLCFIFHNSLAFLRKELDCEKVRMTLLCSQFFHFRCSFRFRWCEAKQ